jgi:hypothetical protein
MPIRRGTYYARTFLLTQPNGQPVDITGWAFLSEFKAGKEETLEALVTLTTASGGWEVQDGPGGVLVMHLLADDTNALTASKVYWDVLRTDADPGPIYLFEASVPVKDTITSVP